MPSLGARAAHLRQHMAARLVEHALYIREHGVDLPEIREWRWPAVQGSPHG